MTWPIKPTCDGDCLHCTHDDCDSGTFSGGRRTPFEREQSSIRQEKAARIKEIEKAFIAWKKRNGITGYKKGDERHELP